MKYFLLFVFLFIGCTNPREISPSSPVEPEVPPWHPDHDINKPPNKWNNK